MSSDGDGEKEGSTVEEGSTVGYVSEEEEEESESEDENRPLSPEEILKGIHKSWVILGLVMGPIVVLGAIWSPAVLSSAGKDSICRDDQDGNPSYANGLSCTGKSVWDEKLWIKTGCESNCRTEANSYGVREREHLSTPACQASLSEFKNLTGYTCNCTSDYAYLPGGVRPGVVLVIAEVVAYIIMAAIIPIMGSVVDHTDWRKSFWNLCKWGVFLSTAGMAMLGENYIWVGGLSFSIFGGIFYEGVYVASSAYLPEITKHSAEAARLGGGRQLYSFGAQLCTFVIAALLINAIGDDDDSEEDLVAIILTLIVALWALCTMPLSYSRMPERKAKKPLIEGKTLTGSAFSDLWRDLQNLKKKYPEAHKYIWFRIFSSLGIGTMIGLSTTFFVEALDLTQSEIATIAGVVLICGMPVAGIIGTLAKKFPMKKLLGAVVAYWIVLGFAPLLLTKKEMFVEAIVVGALCGMGFAAYYSLEFAAFSKLIPPNAEAQYAGFFAATGYILRWISPVVYLVISQTTNDHKWALFHLVAYTIVGAIVFFFIDFEKGRAEAGRKGDGEVDVEMRSVDVVPVSEENESAVVSE